MPLLKEHVDYYVERLRTDAGADAAFSLLELGPEAVPPLIAAYHREQSESVRTELLRIIWEFRSPLALGILQEALRHCAKERWQAALDGLVALASPEAIRVLETVLGEAQRRAKPDTGYCGWLQEALEQAREAHATKQQENC